MCVKYIYAKYPLVLAKSSIQRTYRQSILEKGFRRTCRIVVIEEEVKGRGHDPSVLFLLPRSRLYVTRKGIFAVENVGTGRWSILSVRFLA